MRPGALNHPGGHTYEGLKEGVWLMERELQREKEIRKE